MERKRKFKNLSTMTNLPTHLTDKIETGAQEWATSGSLKEWIDTGMNDTRYSSTLKTFLAGASFLYSLLKEEKGEVGRWVKAKDAPDEEWFGPIRYRWDEKYKHWEYDSCTSREMQNNIENYPDVEWLDTETPVVAGCGELVEALEWYADPGNYLDENGNLATAWKNNEAIARKATSALKTFKR
jgi:hypothetical protein